MDAFFSGFVTAPIRRVGSWSFRYASEHAPELELLIAHIFSSSVWLARGDKFLRSLTWARSVPLEVVVNLVPGPLPSYLGSDPEGSARVVAYNPRAKRADVEVRRRGRKAQEPRQKTNYGSSTKACIRNKIPLAIGRPLDN